MEKRRTIVLIALIAVTCQSHGAKISTKIDLDSSEDRSVTEEPTVKAVFNVDVSKPSSALRTGKTSFAGSRGSARNGEAKKRSFGAYRDSSNQPTVINNVQIVINGSDRELNTKECKNGICAAKVFSRPDGRGNIITDVYLSIVTSLKPQNEDDDVPVIDGTRGLETEDPPVFNLVGPSRPNLMHPQISHRYNPHVQTRYHNVADPWRQGQRPFSRPQTTFYHHGGEGFRGFQGPRTWVPEKPVIDDKIEPPLSKTKPEDA